MIHSTSEITEDLVEQVRQLYEVQRIPWREVLVQAKITEHVFKAIKKIGNMSQRSHYQRKKDFLTADLVEDIRSYYSQHSFKDTQRYFQLSENNLKHICRQYKIHHTAEQKLQHRRQTCLQTYGVTCVLAQPSVQQKSKTPEAIAKSRQTAMKHNMELYGVPYTVQRPDVQAKARQTCWDHWGAANWTSTPEGRAYSSRLHKSRDLQDRTTASKRRNHSFNSSQPEDIGLSLFQRVFGEENALHQYRQDPRYPFSCDFYIKSLDLFVEFNMHWTHGTVPYDEHNPEHTRLRDQWIEQAQTSKFYRIAHRVWTQADVQKNKQAASAKINYLCIYPKGRVFYLGDEQVLQEYQRQVQAVLTADDQKKLKRLNLTGLGANGYIDAQRAQFLALPDERVVKRHKKKK